MKKRLRGFTLVEVLAALGVIIVLTLSLVITIKSQMERAARQHLTALVAVVNSQIAVAYESPDTANDALKSGTAMVDAKVMTAEQWKELSGKVTLTSGSPPSFELDP